MNKYWNGYFLLRVFVALFYFTFSATTAYGKGNTITGRVLNSDGNKVKSATLTLLSDGNLISEQEAGGNGNFKFKKLEDGDYVLQASHDVYGVMEEIINLTGDKDLGDLVLRYKGKEEAYSGTAIQNRKLFYAKPGLRGEKFSIRLLAWEKEFGYLNQNIVGTPVSFKNIKSKSSDNNLFNSDRYETRKIIFKQEDSKKKWILPNGVNWTESFILGSAIFGSVNFMEEGYVALGKNIAIASFIRFMYKWASSSELNNVEFAKVYMEYFPMGSTTPEADIIAGEVGTVTLTIINMSNDKKIRNIEPKLELLSLDPYFGRSDYPVTLLLKRVSRKNFFSNKKNYTIKPNETLVLDYELNIPTVFQKKSISFSGFIGGGKNEDGLIPTYSVIESPEPPKLNLVIKEFNDDDGNGILDGLESASIIGVIENNGLGVSRNPTIVLRNKPTNIIFKDENISFDNIYPGKKKVFNFAIKGQSQLLNGEKSFEFYVSDGRGYEARPEQVTIPTAKFLPPEFKLISWTINDGKIGMADGNNNGLVENGESVEILLNIKNQGRGPAYGSKIDVSMIGFGVIPIQSSSFIGAIGPGAEINIPIGFRVPATFQNKSFSFTIDVEDERKATNYKNLVKVSAEYRAPELSFDYIVHDGTTSGSRGNSNGLIEQGEIIELEFLTQNTGNFDAEDVTLTINFNHSGVSIKTHNNLRGGFSLPIGYIPAKQYGRKQVVPFNIKYTAALGEFELTAMLELANFNGLTEKINLEIYEYSSGGIALGARGTSGFGSTNSQDNDEWINVDNPPLSNNKLKNGFAVVIGNRNYENRDIPQVEYADRDSRIFKTYLTNTIGIPANKILYETDAKLSDLNRIFGTKSNQEGLLYKQVKRLGDNAKVFVFYSGHGAPDLKSNKAYIVPSGASMGNIEFEGYPLDQLLESLGHLPTKDVTLVIDACFSGKTENEMLYKNISPALLKVKSPGVVRGLNVFSSSKNDQVSSWYPKARHGVFSYYFFAGLQGRADSNQDGQITNGEMSNYLDDMVPEKVNELSNFSREQNPTFVGRDDVILLKSYK